MSRGEPAPRGERGPGIAIWASFGVVCLGAALLVLWTMHACETGLGGGAVATSPEPFGGAEAALVPLGTRGCLDSGGPTVGGPSGPATPERVHDFLLDRGYVAAGAAWKHPVATPVLAFPPELAGGCGIVAYVPDLIGHVDSYAGTLGSRRGSCLSSVALVPACEGHAVRVDGSGSLQQRVYLMPGLTPSMVAESGMPVGVLLAHAEAEAHLRSVGWQPADEVVRVSAASGRTTFDGPAEPPSGCVGWVAVSEDFGHGHTNWLGRPVDSDASPHEIAIGLLSCRSGAGAAPAETTLTVYDEDGSGGDLFFRPYAPASGPIIAPTGPHHALGLGSMRVVASAPASLPAAVPMNAPIE